MEKQKDIPVLCFPEFKVNAHNSHKKHLFKDIFLFSTGKNIKQNEASPEFATPCVRYGELYHLYNEVINEVINKTNLDKSELLFSQGDEILLPSAGEDPLDIGSASALTVENIAIGRTINILKPMKANIYSQVYVSYYINQKLRKKISTLAKGVSISNVYNSDLKTLEIILPNLPEQQKIATFFTAIDQKISQLKKKKNLLVKYKKGVMQQIFSQQKRFKDDDGKEFPHKEMKKLGDFLDYAAREVQKPKSGYLAIGVRSHCKGTFQKPDSDPDKIVIDKLFVVRGGDLIVNITFTWEGAIAIVKNEDDGGLVSHRFPTYVFRKELVHGDFFRHVFIQKKFRKILDLISPGGAGRNRVLSKKDFLKITCEIPSLKEQTKIANFLSAIDAKITHTQKQIENAEVWKKGLMQKMFV